jgi:hypothetical protein
MYSALNGLDIAVSIAGVVGAIATVVGVIHQIRSSKRKRPAPTREDDAISSPGEAEARPLELKLSWMIPTYDNGTLGPDAVGLTLVNRMSHPVRWISASIDLQDDSGRHLALIDTAPPGMGLPQQVASHDSTYTMVAVQQLRDQGFDLSRPITGRASIATGETVASDPWTAGH